MTLRQAVETALQQSPDIALARIEEESKRQAVRLAKDPFFPRLTVGSGLAYSNGFPMSIEGSAPSVVQARAIQDIFNRPQSLLVSQAREDARAAGLDVTSKRDEVAYRTTALYLDAERAARIGELARRDADSQQKVLETVEARVREGRALPLEQKSAALSVARARQAAGNLEADQASAESALATVLGFPAGDRVRPAAEERPTRALPASDDGAVHAAIDSSKELRHIQSQIMSKQIEVRGQRAARLPRVDLVAQYAMLAKFNNYDQFFSKFQRNNGQLGVSFQLPLLSGPGVSAQEAQSLAEIARLKIELANTRNRIASDLEQSFRDAAKAARAAEVARLDLEVAREQLSVNLARMQEGRLTLREVEEARIIENRKWIAFYDAQYTVEKANWSVLHLTGDLLASIESLPAQ